VQELTRENEQQKQDFEVYWYKTGYLYVV
jgi:hypothetical protein